MYVHTLKGEKMIADVSQTPDILIFVLFRNMGDIKLKYIVVESHRPRENGFKKKKSDLEHCKV